MVSGPGPGLSVVTPKQDGVGSWSATLRAFIRIAERKQLPKADALACIICDS